MLSPKLQGSYKGNVYTQSLQERLYPRWVRVMPRIQTYLNGDETAAFYRLCGENGTTPYEEMRKAMLKHLGIVEPREKKKEADKNESRSGNRTSRVDGEDSTGSGKDSGIGKKGWSDAELDRRIEEIRRKLESGGESE